MVPLIKGKVPLIETHKYVRKSSKRLCRVRSVMCRILPVYGVIMAISYSGLLAGRYRLQLRPLRPGEEGRTTYGRFEWTPLSGSGGFQVVPGNSRKTMCQVVGGDSNIHIQIRLGSQWKIRFASFLFTIGGSLSFSIFSLSEAQAVTLMQGFSYTKRSNLVKR